MTNNESSRTRSLLIALVTAALGASVFATAACNAVKGAGKDLEEASDNVKDAIEDED